MTSILPFIESPILRLHSLEMLCQQRRCCFNGYRRYRQYHLVCVRSLECVQGIDSKVLVICVFVSLLGSQSGVLCQDENQTASPSTAQRDIDALLEIKRHLLAYSNRTDALISWDEGRDPCLDKWSGVVCNCSDLSTFDDFLAPYCDDYIPSQTEARVISLRLLGGTAEDEKWDGDLCPDIGKLDRLRLLDLSRNRFVGPIPKTFENLSRLRYFKVSDNALNGTIPEFFGNFSKLARVELDNNNFKGSVPEMACGEDNNTHIISINNNFGLCGNLSKCMENLVTNLNYTHVNSSILFNNISGVCDETEPVCEDSGCNVTLPTYWTALDRISFEFVEFIDRESEIENYRIEVYNVRQNRLDERRSDSSIFISSPNLTNSTLIEGMYNGSVIELRRYTINERLNGTVLQNGKRYNISVIATNGAGPPLSKEFAKGTVIVDATKPEAKQVYNT